MKDRMIFLWTRTTSACMAILRLVSRVSLIAVYKAYALLHMPYTVSRKTNASDDTDDILNELSKIYVDKDRYSDRLGKCMVCQHLDQGTTCKICTCYVSVKAWLATEQCPINKWK